MKHGNLDRTLHHEQLLRLVYDNPDAGITPDIDGLINLLEWIQDNIDDNGSVTLSWQGAPLPPKPSQDEMMDWLGGSELE